MNLVSVICYMATVTFAMYLFFTVTGEIGRICGVSMIIKSLFSSYSDEFVIY